MMTVQATLGSSIWQLRWQLEADTLLTCILIGSFLFSVGFFLSILMVCLVAFSRRRILIVFFWLVGPGRSLRIERMSAS